jgi:hypothetical protein
LTGQQPEAADSAITERDDATTVESSFKRFVRNPQRKKHRDPEPEPVVVVPPAEPETESTDAPPAPEDPAVAVDRAGEGQPTVATAEELSQQEEPAPLPRDDEFAELPILDVSAPAPPRPVHRFWTWTKVSLAGMVSGLVMLVLLWIWRELERLHYRLTRAA